MSNSNNPNPTAQKGAAPHIGDMVKVSGATWDLDPAKAFTDAGQPAPAGVELVPMISNPLQSHRRHPPTNQIQQRKSPSRLQRPHHRPQRRRNRLHPHRTRPPHPPPWQPPKPTPEDPISSPSTTTTPRNPTSPPPSRISKTYLAVIHDAYNLPIWVTEFAMATP
ncbi:MAG: hypothetical protein Q9182_007126 [Xanthomendoza sp. 2 TL-2023]